MITIEPTRDLEWMWTVATNRAVYDGIRGGGHPERSSMEPVVSDHRNHFLAMKRDGTKLGFFAYHYVNEWNYALHICILPEGRGLSALDGFQKSIAWMFGIGAVNIVAIFDKARRDVAVFLGWAGFKKTAPGIYKIERT